LGLETENKGERPKRSIVPLSFYSLKDSVAQLAGNKNFQDALITSFALASIAIAFPFLPIYLLIPLILCVFILTIIHPLLGLISLLLSALPMLLYQVPLLVWIFTIIVSISLILGYKYYRTITYAYALVFLSLSYLGLLFVIPGFIIAVLVLGFKRGAALAAVVIAMSVMTSGLTGISLSGPIVYNQVPVHSQLASQPFAVYLTPARNATTLDQVLPSLSASLGTLFLKAPAYLYSTFYFSLSSIANQFLFSFLQLCVWLFAVFTISSYAVKSRSPYKGTLSSLFGVMLLISYIPWTTSRTTGRPRRSSATRSWLQ